MKSKLNATLLATISLLMTSAVQAADDAAVQTAPSVAAMLQGKQEAQLREQYVREGRLDDVRKLDEAKAQRVQLPRRNKKYCHCRDAKNPRKRN